MTMQQSVRRVLVAQVIGAGLLVLLVLAATALWSGAAQVASSGVARAAAVAFGSLLGILATLVTARSVLKSSRAVTDHPHLGLLPVYAGLLLKLLVVAGGAFVGLAYLRLGPLYVVLGYLAMQTGYLWAARNPNR